MSSKLRLLASRMVEPRISMKHTAMPILKNCGSRGAELLVLLSEHHPGHACGVGAAAPRGTPSIPPLLCLDKPLPLSQPPLL